MSENQTTSLDLHSYPCGPSTMTIDSLDWSDASLIYACGKYEAQKSTNGSGAVNPGRVSKLVTFVFLLFSFVCARENETLLELGIVKLSSVEYGDNVYNCTKKLDLSYDVVTELKRLNVSALNDQFEDRYLEFADVDVEEALDSMPDDESLEKRCTPTGRVQSVTEWQTANSGTWWSPWYPISCCHYCDYGPATCTNSLSYSYTYSWSVSGGLDWGAVKASTSFSITKSYTNAAAFQCQWNGGSGPAQIWYQQQVYYVNRQSRKKIFGQNGCMVVTPWSEYKHADAPIKGLYHVGCSVGKSVTDCDAGQVCVRY